MWASFVLSLLVVQILLFVKRLWKTSKRKLDYQELKEDKIPELSSLGVIMEMLKAATIYSCTPSYEASYNLAKKIGPLSIVRFSKVIPFHPQVFVNSTDLDTCKKVMSSPKWPDRFPENHYIHTCSFNKPFGFLSGGGEHYKRARQLSLKLLHDSGTYGPTPELPSRMEGLVLFEMAEVEASLTQRIDAAGGELTFTPHQMFQVSTLNMVWLMMMGQRFSHQDPLVYQIIHWANESNRKFYAPYTIMEVLPFLKYFPRLTSLGAWQDCVEFFYGVFKEIIAEKRKEPLEERLNRQPTDLVDGFIQQIDKLGGKDEYLTDENLMVVMRDMVFAGSDTTNSALEYGLLYVSLNPKVQRKVQEEIDQVVGINRAPVYADKFRMNYTQAVLLETLRLGSSVPGIVRSAIEDTEVHGVPFKKGTLFGINFYGINRSEQLWEDPLVFRPERFLDENQNLINQEKIMPFGYGKRSCMGETVALVTLFIFFVTLLQKFEFQISPDHPAPSFKNVFGISRCALPYYLRARKRTVV